MQGFRFRMDHVLEWYRKQREIEEQKLAECIGALSKVEESIARFRAERLTVERDLVTRSELSACDLVSLGLYRMRARKQELELNLDRERKESGVRQQRAEWQAAQRRVRLLEKLRGRRLAEHEYLEQRELENLAADAYLAKWVRKQASAPW